MVIPSDVFGLFDTDDLDMPSYPFRGKIDAPAISALLDLLFNHFLSLHFKLGLIGGKKRLSG